MAVALQTSKRKFYKILDNLTTSQTSLSSQHDNNKNPLTTSVSTSRAEPPPKRTRFSDELMLSKTKEWLNNNRAGINRPSTATSGRSIRHVTTPAKSSSKLDEDDSPRPTPNYTPYSQTAFLARLKTFADVKFWGPKPEKINDVEWAKRGWICEARDTVACKGGCEKRVVVAFNSERHQIFENARIGGKKGKDVSSDDLTDRLKYETDKEDALAERYRALIVEGHDESCLWRRAGCKEDIYRIRIADPTVWRGELAGRYQALLAIEDELPQRIELPEDIRVEELIGKLPRGLLKRESAPGPTKSTAPQQDGSSPSDDAQQALLSTTNSTAPDSFNRTAFTLALFGWTGQQQSGLQLAHCERCFQRIGLWLYTSRPPSTVARISDPSEVMAFNPAELHRLHCPWTNAWSQCALGNFKGLAGWRILVELIKGTRQRDEHGGEADAGSGAGQGSPERKSRKEVEMEDREREGKIARLRRAFSIKRPKSGGAKQ